MVKLICGVFAGVTIGLFAGCSSTAPAPQQGGAVEPQNSAVPVPRASPSGAPEPAIGTDDRVIIDGALNRTLRVMNVISLTSRNGLLKVQVDVQNITDAPRWFSYRLEWFDEKGKLLPIGTVGSQPWMLLAHETSSIVATAPAETAKDFGVAFLPVAQ